MSSIQISETQLDLSLIIGTQFLDVSISSIEIYSSNYKCL